MYFMSFNATFAVAAHTRKVSQRPCTCRTTGNILILHKPLVKTQETHVPCVVKDVPERIEVIDVLKGCVVISQIRDYLLY